MDDPYPDLGRELLAASVGEWTRLVFRGELSDGQARMSLVQHDPDGTRRSLRLRDLPRMAKLLQAVRRQTDAVSEGQAEPWTTMVFTFEADGRFHIDFEYA